MRKNKMTVEIWRDITCPFSYIAKKNFDEALSQFKEADSLNIVWKNFQPAPYLKMKPEKNLIQFLTKGKSVSPNLANAMSKQVADAATRAGLTYQMDQTIPANSFKASRLSLMAKR